MNAFFVFLHPFLVPIACLFCGSLLTLLAAAFFFRRKNRRFRELVNRLPAVRCIVIDDRGKVCFFRTDGHDDFPAHPKTYDDFPEETRRDCGEDLHEAFRTRRSMATEYTFRERRLHIEINYLDPRVFGRAAVFWLATDLNLTYRRGEGFRRTLCALDDAAVSVDGNGTVTFVNPAAAQLLDSVEHELTGARAGELFHLEDAATGAVSDPLETALRTGQIVRLTDPQMLTLRSGVRKCVAAGVSPVPGPGAVLVLRDIESECAERDCLTESNRLLKQALDLSDVFFFRCHSPETFLHETPPDPRFWGTAADGSALPPEQWIFCEDFPGFAAAWGNFFARRTEQFTQTYRIGTAAPFRTFEMTIQAVSGGRKTVYCGVIREITEKIESDRALARANGLTRALVEALPNAAYLRRIDGSGETAPAAVNHAYRTLTAPDGQNAGRRFEAAVRDFLADGERMETRRVSWSADASPNLTGELFLSRFLLSDRSEYLFSSFRDLSRETRDEEALTGFANLVRTAFEFLPGCHLLLDFDDSGRILLASRSTEHYFNRPFSAITGKTFRDLLSPDAADAAELNLRRAIDSGLPENTEEDVVCADGSTIHCMVSRIPVPDRSGGTRILFSFYSLDKLSLPAEGNALYMAAFKEFPFPALLLDADDDLRAIAWNPAMEKHSAGQPVDPLPALEAARKCGDSVLAGQLENAIAAHRRALLHSDAGKTGATVELVRIEKEHDAPVRVVRTPFEVRGRRFLLVTVQDISAEEEQKTRQRKVIADLENELKDERSVNGLLCRIGVMENDDAQLRDILRTFGAALEADRFFVAGCSESDGRFSTVAEWRGSNSEEPMLFFEPASEAAPYPGWMEKFKRGEKIVLKEFSGTHDLADTSAENDPLNLLNGDIRSLALIPVLDGAKLVALTGVCCFSQGKRTAFSSAGLHLLESAADLLLTRHRRAETARQVSENRDRVLRIFDTIQIPMYMFDADYRIVSVNMEAVKLLGKNRNYLMGKSCCSEVCSSSEPPEWCPAAAVFRTGRPAHHKLSRDGRTFLIDAQGVFDRSGRLVNCIESFHDVTEEEERLRQTEINFRFLNTAAEAAKITYFRCSPELQLVFLGGLRPDGIPGDSVSAPGWFLPEDRALFHGMFRRVLTSGAPESEVLRSDASGSVVSYRTVLIPGDSSREVFGIFQNVTEQRTATEEKNRLIRQMDSYVSMERLMNDLLTAMIHETEFKKNLNHIMDDVFRMSDCDRIDFGRYSEDGASFAPESERQSSALTSSTLFRDPLIQRHLSREAGFLNGEHVLRLEDLHAKLRAYFIQVTGCSSMSAVSVYSSGRRFGILAICFRKAGRGVSALDDAILRSAAHIISLAKEQENKQQLISKFDLERRIIFDNIKIPFLFFEKRNLLTRVNPAVCRISGAKQSDLEGKPCGRIFCRENTDLPFCPVERAFEIGFSQTHKVTLYGREYILNAEPILNPDGSVRHVVETATDVTEINESSRQLEKALAAAQSAERAKSYFLATMSHELRTPLNAVIGFSELLLHTKADAREHQEYLHSINVAGNALLRLINDVLDLSKLEADQMPITPVRSDFSAFMKELETIFSQRAAAKKLFFHFVLPEHLPLLYVDIARFRHVMFNIVGNAIKFTEEGGITVTTEFTETDASHGQLAVSVADTGAGIDPDLQKGIFDPFVQQQTIRGQRNTEGTGLGLAISKRMVERMKGELTLKSEPGSGSVFSIHIPRVRFELPSASAPEEPPAKTAVAPAPDGLLDILLVDDVPVNLKVLEAQLRRFPCRVRSAYSATEAVDLFDARHCQVVLSDLRMPGKDGWSLAEELKKRAPDPAALRIWILTASGQDLTNLHPEWVEGVLSKPVTRQQLQDLLFPAETPVIAVQNHIISNIDQAQGTPES